MPIMDFQAIKEKQQQFKQEFIASFRQELQKSHDIATGITEVNIEYGPIGSIAKTLVENLTGAAAGAIPLIGPFIANTMSAIPTQVYEYYQRKQLTKTATDNNDYIAEMGISVIESVIEETAHEIARVFEYQIAMLKITTDVQKLAGFAVNKIFRHASDNAGNIAFNRNDLLKALVTEEALSSIDRAQLAITREEKLKTLEEFIWQMRKIFTNVGLREEVDGGGYSYHVKIGSQEKDIKYGYRAKIAFWDESSKAFIPSELDHGYIQDPSANSIDLDARSYMPLMRLVSQREVDEYCHHVLPSKQATEVKTSFREFFNEVNYGQTQTNIIPVFREARFALGSDLHNSDFSNVDMTRILFSDSDIQNSDFTDSYMILAEISISNVENSRLKSTDLRWSKLSALNLRGNTILTQANFDYAFLDEETDLTDNHSFATAATAKAIITSNKLMETVFVRLDKYEELMQQMQRELATQKTMQEYQQSLQTSDIYFYNAREVVHSFVGRSIPLTQLHDYFMQHENAVQVIGGLGGMGKTQTALQYINEHKAEYNYRVRWIAASSEIALSLSFREFAETLGMRTDKESDEEILRWVKHKLSNKVEKTLLVFDNTESQAMISKYLPDSDGRNQHHVLITTRNIKDWQDTSAISGNNIIRLNPFEQEESLHYINQFVPDAEREEALELARTFDNIPLGLSQSVAYIKVNRATIRDYLDEYQRVRLLQEQESLHDSRFEARSEAGHMASIYTTLSMTISSLSSSPKAVKLLKLCSYLDADAIPGYLFDSMFDSNNIEKSRSFAILKGYSLLSVKLEGENKFIFLHRIVQKVTKMKFNFESSPILLQVMKLIDRQLEYSYDAIKLFQKNQPLLQHVIALVDHYQQAKYSSIEENENATNSKQLDIFMVKLHRGCGNVYYALARYDKALAQYEEALRIKQVVYGNEHAEVAVTLNEISNVYRYLDRYNEALVNLERALQVRKAVYGNEHLKVAETLHAIGNIYRDLGRYNEALAQYEEVLRITKAAYSKEHISVIVTLTTMEVVHHDLNIHNEASVAMILATIGMVYRHLGRHNEALAKLEEALRINKAVYNNDHLNIAETLNAIGNVYRDVGRYNEALTQYEEALRIKKTVYGNEHPEVAVTIHEIGNAYYTLGRHNEALVQYEKALRIKKAVYGNEHAKVAETLGAIGNVYSTLGRHNEALAQYEEDLRITRAVYGNKHPEVATILHAIGHVYYTLGRHNEALMKYEESLRINKAAYGNEHANVAEMLHAIGNVYRDLSRHNEALVQYEGALWIKKAVYGNEHAKVAETFGAIGNIYRILGRYNEALAQYEEALRIKRIVYGNEHSNVAVIIHEIGNVYRNLGRHNEALVQYEEALRIKRIVYGNEHSNVAVTMHEIGNVYNALGRHIEALVQYEEASRIFKAIYGNEYFEVAMTLHAIGNIYSTLGRHNEALAQYEEALRIKKVAYGNEHPEVAATLHGIGMVYYVLDQKVKALEFFKQALAMSVKFFNDNHPVVKVYLSWVQGTEKSMQSTGTAIKISAQSVILLDFTKLKSGDDLSMLSSRQPDSTITHPLLPRAEEDKNCCCIIAYTIESEYENPMLNNQALLLQKAKALGGTKFINDLIELGHDKQVAQAIIAATEEYGVEHVLNILFASIDKISFIINDKTSGAIALSQSEIKNIPIFEGNTRFKAEYSAQTNQLLLSSFVAKEAIEAMPMIKYFMHNILHIKYSLPEFMDNNYVKITAHYAVCNLGMFTATAKLDLVASSMPTILYSSKILSYELLAQAKQTNFQNTENKSIVGPVEFIQKCGFAIVAQMALGSFGSMLTGTPAAYDLAISASVGGMQCYNLYNQAEKLTDKSSDQASAITTILPYVADAAMIYVMTSKTQFDFSTQLGQMLAVKQTLAIMSSIVMTDHMTKLVILATQDTIQEARESYIEPAFNYAKESLVGIIEQGYTYCFGAAGGAT